MRRLLITSISVLALTACESTPEGKSENQPVAVNTQGQFTVFDGVQEKAVQSSQTTVSQTGEILARVMIPAQYNTLPNGTRVLIGSAQGRPVQNTPQLGSVSPYAEIAGATDLIAETIPGEKETVTSIEKISDFRTELVQSEPVYETVIETVVVQPQSVTYEVVKPAEYGWVDGIVQHQSVEYETVPPTYETVQETVVVQEASTELINVPGKYKDVGGLKVEVEPPRVIEKVVPAVTKTETRRVIKTPARTVEKIIPSIQKDGKTYTQIKPAQRVEKVIPPVTKQVERRVVKTPASTRERVIPEPVYREVSKVISKTPDQYVVRDREGRIVKRFANADEFAKFQNNPYKRVTETPISTFSADVDTASYSFVRQFVERGQLPPQGSVRVEEMVNYFDYDYEKPADAIEPFKPNIKVVPSPWNAETKLVHIGVQGYEAPSQQRPDMNLVFLIDVSGSMKEANKLPLLKKSLQSLIKQLRSGDRISIVTYADEIHTVLDGVSGRDKDDITAAIAGLHAQGGTAGAAGIQRAYEVAAAHFNNEGANRIILATDGDFNIGLSGIDALTAYISDKRKSDIYLSVLGFGQGNLKDHRMQALAQNGNGIAGYIDSLQEARKFFEVDMGKNMLPIANDLKLQVEFNPERVAEYRLIGYETRALKREDFNNEKVDAGDVGQGHAVTALYEINPKGSPRQFVDPLRYGKEAAPMDTSFVNEYGFLKIRFKRPGERTSNLITAPVTDSNRYDHLDKAPESTRFAVAVAAYGLKLRGDQYLDGIKWEDVTELAMQAKGLDRYGHRAEFVELTRSAQSLKVD